jgi:hypothetical protein
MADLLGATETAFETDFAILGASQGNVSAAAGTFAGSSIGGLSAHCGTKYAGVHVRTERWSGRPEFDNSWEDMDELPFQAIVGGGPLQISGFDPPSDDHGLDLEGFGSGRVLILAKGRHRYYYGDVEDELPPEEWLLQFFPQEGTPNPLAGPPRRLVGFAPFSKWEKQSGWKAAIHAWDQTGWHSHLFNSPGYYAVHLGMSLAARAIDARNLASQSSSFTRNGSPNPLPFPEDPLNIRLAERIDDPLAALYGAPVQTLGEAIDAMRHLNLLLDVVRGDETLLVPNPAPENVWEAKSMTEQEIRLIRLQIGYADFRSIAEDIVIAVSWAGEKGLKTTIQEMGTRWSTTSAAIRGGLALSALTSGVSTDPTLDNEKGDDDQLPIVITKTGYWSV